MTRLPDIARNLALAVGLAAPLAAAGCATSDTTPGMTVVTVEAGYRERILLPPGHILTVRIEDVSLADAPATVMAEVVQPLEGRGPPYRVSLACRPRGSTPATPTPPALRSMMRRASWCSPPLTVTRS